MKTMKDNWICPDVDVQQFAPQEFVAVCDNTGATVTYYFQCNAGSYTRWQEVYLETNGREGLQTNGSWSGTIWNPIWTPGDEYQGRYHACDETHEVVVDANAPFNIDAEFPKGYLHAAVEQGGYTTYEWIPVRIWTDNGTNLHCTTNIGEEHYTPHNPS